MASPEVFADELIWNVLKFIPARVFVVSPFDEELELVVLCRDAVFQYFLNIIFSGMSVTLFNFPGSGANAGALCGRGAFVTRSEFMTSVAPLRSMMKVRSLLCCTRYGPSAVGFQIAFLLTTVGRVSRDVVSRTDVHICAAHSFVKVLLVARLPFLQAVIGACDCLVESNEEFIPVPAVRFRAISQNAVQRERGWRPTQYEVEGRRPSGPMDMAVLGVRQRGRVLVPGVLIFFDEAHEHVLKFSVVAFRLAVGLGVVCRGVHITQPEGQAYALKEPGSELLPVVCQN